MLISEFSSREEVLSVASKELKEIGIKVRSEKYKQIEVIEKSQILEKKSSLKIYLFSSEQTTTRQEDF